MTLQVAINAQLVPGTGAGGTECVLIGLVKALGRLEGPEQYILVGPWEHPDWLKPYVGHNQRIVRGPKSQAVKRALRPIKPLIRMVRRASAWMGNGNARPRVAQSNGFYEHLGCGVIHFPYQHFVASGIPAVFNPHDLQHVHLPQFFSRADLQWREATYATACRAAHTVVVHSNWVKKDVIRHYDLTPAKVQVILTPPPVQAYAEPTADVLEIVRRTYAIEGDFALYPAMTFEHKNHLRLLDAVALLRTQGLRIQLICTGHKTSFFSKIEHKLRELALHDQVRFLGMIPAEHLRGMYRLAQFIVFPTLFEGAGLPLVEAWAEGRAITCSAVTSLAELAADAALLFDPSSIEAVAAAIEKMARDTSLRQTLVERGHDQLNRFSWENTAKMYRAVYRRAAGAALSDEDQWLLSTGSA